MRRIIVLAALIFAVVLALDVYPGLRGGAGWQWAYQAPQALLPVIALAAGLVLYLIGLLWLRPRTVSGSLAWIVVSGTLLAVLVVGISGDPFYTLFTRTVSPVQTGASALQARIMSDEGVLPTLQRWPQIMDEALGQNLIHFTTSPPGQVLLAQTAADVFDSPALTGISTALSRPLRLFQCSDEDVMRYTRGEIASAGLFAYLMPLFAALTAVPLYLIARDLTGDRRLAVNLASWWPLVPAVLMFAPTWNTVYPALCALSFWLLLRGLLRNRLGWTALAGLVMAFTTLLNFAVLPFFLLAGLFTLGFLRDIRRSVVFGLVFGLGVLVPWIIYTVVTGVSPLDILRQTFGAHSELVRRDYLPWLILHPYDVLLFTGLPAAVLAVLGAAKVIRDRRLDPLGVFTLSMATTVLLVNIAGIVQGENARILIFYMPFLLNMGAGTLLGRSTSHDAPLLGAQALVLLAMASVLAVVPFDMDPMPSGPRTDIGSLGDVVWIEDGAPFLSTEYAGEFALVRYRWVGDPSRQALSYEFEFAGRTPTERPYQFELVARADSDMGEIISEPFRWWSQGAEYPPTCWRSGEIIRDTIVMPLPPVPHPVIWDVILRAVDERTGSVMLTAGANALQLAPVSYP